MTNYNPKVEYVSSLTQQARLRNTSTQDMVKAGRK